MMAGLTGVVHEQRVSSLSSVYKPPEEQKNIVHNRTSGRGKTTIRSRSHKNGAQTERSQDDQVFQRREAGMDRGFSVGRRE